MLINSDKLQKELIAKGLNRAKDFSWNKTVKDIISIYENDWGTIAEQLRNNC